MRQQEHQINPSGDVTLETQHRLPFGPSFIEARPHGVLGSLVHSDAREDDDVKRRVGLMVAAAIQLVVVGFA